MLCNLICSIVVSRCRARCSVVALVLVAAWVLFGPPAPARAWGLEGHRIIGIVAMRYLPTSLPAFLRTPSARDEIIYLQAEEDRLKIGEGQEAWDREWTTDHYLDVDDRGMIGGAVALDALPATRDEYEQALERAGVDAYNVGFLPYAILEGYEQVVSDFALWRQAMAAAAGNGQNDVVVRYREALTIHDIGIVSHFIGDGSQPLHVTVHYNGWGRYPNPQGFSTSRTTHAEFETDWVERYMTPDGVDRFFTPAQVFDPIPMRSIERYLATTNAQVVPFYKLTARGGFELQGAPADAHAQAIRFTAERLAAGASMLDSLILTAWRASADLSSR